MVDKSHSINKDRETVCYFLYKGEYQNKHYNINQKDEGTQDDRGRDGGTNFILRIKEQETCLTLQEHDDDEKEITYRYLYYKLNVMSK